MHFIVHQFHRVKAHPFGWLIPPPSSTLTLPGSHKALLDFLQVVDVVCEWWFMIVRRSCGGQTGTRVSPLKKDVLFQGPILFCRFYPHPKRGTNLLCNLNGDLVGGTRAAMASLFGGESTIIRGCCCLKTSTLFPVREFYTYKCSERLNIIFSAYSVKSS